uniref:F-box associated beta-propeller type 3 domain-containing protein n=1 Tax=Quercus lobata TaxID=97700 RepID=A0A7N2LSY9_QUELO
MLDIFEEVAGQPKPSEMILSFDVNSEKFKELPLPKDDSFIRGGFETCLTMFKGKLALIQFGLVQQYGPHVMQYWVMREYGLPESWKKFCVVLVESPTNFVGFTKYGSLLFQTKSEPKKEDKFVLVDPKTQYKKDNIHLKYPLEVNVPVLSLVSLSMLHFYFRTKSESERED